MAALIACASVIQIQSVILFKFLHRCAISRKESNMILVDLTTNAVTQQHLSRSVQSLWSTNTIDSGCSELHSPITKIEHYICTELKLCTTLYCFSGMLYSILVTGECSSKQLESTVFIDHKLHTLLDRYHQVIMLDVKIPSILLCFEFQPQIHAQLMLPW